MKLKLKLLAIVLLISTVAMAQRQERQGSNSSPEEKAQRRAETLKAKLKLSDAQYKDVYNELLATEKHIRAQREEIKKMRTEHDAKMKSILSAEQYAQLKEMQKQRRENMKEKRGGRMDKKFQHRSPAPEPQKEEPTDKK